MILNNFFGRQFNSLNDVAINPRNGEIYFTDVAYAHWQDFRPSPGLPNQIYRFHPQSGRVSVVSDDLDKPNGVTFSPDGKYAYATDTGPMKGFLPIDETRPAAVYRYDVEENGTWSGKKIFAFVSPGIPDGVHCDTRGNVYAGCGDGIQVWNPSGVLMGKIFLGERTCQIGLAYVLTILYRYDSRQLRFRWDGSNGHLRGNRVILCYACGQGQ